jgi:hypothetical protein
MDPYQWKKKKNGCVGENVRMGEEKGKGVRLSACAQVKASSVYDEVVANTCPVLDSELPLGSTRNLSPSPDVGAAMCQA